MFGIRRSASTTRTAFHAHESSQLSLAGRLTRLLASKTVAFWLNGNFTIHYCHVSLLVFAIELLNFLLHTHRYILVLLSRLKDVRRWYLLDMVQKSKHP